MAISRRSRVQGQPDGRHPPLPAPPLEVDGNGSPERRHPDHSTPRRQEPPLAKAAACSSSKNTNTPRQRGAKNYAELIGFSASQDAYSVPNPTRPATVTAWRSRKAMAEAKVSPADVGLLVPHGSESLAHDRRRTGRPTIRFRRFVEQIPCRRSRARSAISPPVAAEPRRRF